MVEVIFETLEVELALLCGFFHVAELGELVNRFRKVLQQLHLLLVWLGELFDLLGDVLNGLVFCKRLLG